MKKPSVVLLRIAPFLEIALPHPRDLLWPVSFLYARAILERQGVQVEILDTWARRRSPRDLLQTILDLSPDFLFIQTRTPTVALMLELGRQVRLRHPDIVIWGIGQHAGERPEDFLFEGSPFNGCVHGEIEAVIPHIVDGESDVHGTVLWDEACHGVIRKGGPSLVADLDALPMLDPIGLEIDRYRMLSLHVPTFRKPRWGYLFTSRGCPYRCIFCSPTLRQSYGTAFRGQSAERFADEVGFLKRKYGIDAFYAIDDLFTGDAARVRAICDTLIERRIKVAWTIQTRLDQLDAPLLRLLHAAGCVGIKVGIETGSQRVSAILKKDLDPDRALAVAEEIRRLGIHLTACYLVGNPTETLAEMEETLRFARKIGAVMVQVAYHTPYPGSESYSRFTPYLGQNVPGHFDGAPVNLSAASTAELIGFHRDFYLRYYLDPRQFGRYLRHRAVYRVFRLDELDLFIRTLGYLAAEGLKKSLQRDDENPFEM